MNDLALFDLDHTLLPIDSDFEWGQFLVRQGVVDAPIGRSIREPTRTAVTEQGRDAVTRYEVVQTFDQPVEVALLACKLETGRTHQIRVHLTALGHAVVGDDRYHGYRQSLVVPRLFLHAGRLGGVALDVHYQEPVPDDDELLSFDNVILTPRMAGSPRFNGLQDFEQLITGLARELAAGNSP